jgi:hypothetical protein
MTYLSKSPGDPKLAKSKKKEKRIIERKNVCEQQGKTR